MSKVKTTSQKSKLNITHQHLVILFLVLAIIIGFALLVYSEVFQQKSLDKPTIFGLTFTPAHAKSLGENPKTVFDAILYDLKVKHIRLSAKWDEIEPKPGKFDFTDLDYYIKEAGKNKVDILLAIGFKLPRWPECYAPKWMDMYNTRLRQQETLVMLKKVVDHYEGNPAISAWQVENEPLLDFGICPPADPKFLNEELLFIRGLTKKPIVMTDSGELSLWITSMQSSDYFGTTLYRSVHNDLLGKLQYPLQPWFYSLKSGTVRKMFAPNNKETWVMELQTEPWTQKFIKEVPVKEQFQSFSPDQFKNNVDFARKSGFGRIYLWGVEWWYEMKTENHPQYWNFAKTLF